MSFDHDDDDDYSLFYTSGSQSMGHRRIHSGSHPIIEQNFMSVTLAKFLPFANPAPHNPLQLKV